MRLDPLVVQQQINNLLLQVPELAEDEILRADMIEAETDTHELLIDLEEKRQLAIELADGARIRIETIRERLGRYERRIEAIRNLMFRLMELADLRKVELPVATLSIANGQRKVIITDENALPDVYCRFKREADKAKIAIQLKSGNSIVGAELSNSEPHLTIRTK